MKKRLFAFCLTLCLLVGLLPTTVLAVPEANGTGQTAEDPMLVTADAMVIKNNTYYGVSKTWFTEVNPDKATLYVALQIPNTVTTIANDAFRDNYTYDKARYGAVTTYDKLGQCKVAAIDFSQATGLTAIKYQAAMSCSDISGVLDLSHTNVNTIEKSAFNGCTGLTGVILPDTLEVLGTADGTSGSVFKDCTGLEFLRTASSGSDVIFELPANLKVIGKDTFKDNFRAGTELKVHIPESVEIIGSQAFYNKKFAQIYIDRQSGYDGYDSDAFKNVGLLILPNNEAYKGTGSFTRTTKTYPVTLKFMNGSDLVDTQLKLYGQSIQYTRDEDGIWYQDDTYTLPDPGSVGNTPGYDAGWKIYDDTKILTNTSKVSGRQDVELEVSVVNDVVVSKPTVEYMVNGSVVQDAGSGVPELTVTVDRENAGSVGVQVTHPLATEEAKESGTYVYFKYCWWDEKDNSVNGPRSETEPELFSTAITSGNYNRVFTDQNVIPIRNVSDARTDDDYYLVEIYGYYVENNRPAIRYYKSGHNFIAGDYATDRSYVMNADVVDTTPITITPADITIYTGGEGYTGVVDSAGSQTAATNGLPEPGYYITLPDWINDQLGGDSSAENLAGRLVFKYNDNEGVTREWKLELYGTEAHSSDVEGTDRQRYIYRMLPGTDGDGQEIPVRLQLTDSEGHVIASDEFSPDMENQYQEYSMRIYSGELDPSKITAVLTLPNDQTVTCGVNSADGKLVVRGLTGEDITTEIISNTDELSGYGITALATNNVTYYINGSNVELKDTEGVRLLVDDVLDDGVLAEYIQDNMEDIPAGDYAYEQRYLDLVDTKNGNAYLTMGKDDKLTIYWKVPEGFDDSKPFYVIHFDALDRNYDNLDVELSGNQPDVIEPELVTVNGAQYVKFDTSSFSPFVLVWDRPSGGTVIPPAATHTITATAGSGGSISPSGEVAVTEGTDQAFTITPDKGNKVRDVAIDGKSVGALGSYTFEDVRGDHTISVTFTRGNAPADPDDTGVSDWFETGDHDAFMHGYDDGTGRFGPDDNMTRGEAAQMFYNMLKDKSRGDVQFDFEDLSEGAWYYEAVATMASHGILLGTSPTTVEPERPITRAEFTAMAMRFSKGDLSGENIFTDVSEGDWYYGVIVGSIKYGWISGYDDGTGRFGPNDNITRAQATTIANRMLGRVADGVFVSAHLDEIRRFPDVDEGFYAFLDIAEATNSHDYAKDGGFEHWSALR